MLVEPIERLDVEAWRSCLDTNVTGTIQVTQQLLPLVRNQLDWTRYVVRRQSVLHLVNRSHFYTTAASTHIGTQGKTLTPFDLADLCTYREYRVP